MKNERLYGYSFANIYSLYVAKVTRKGRTKPELNKVITWLTGYTTKGLESQIKKGSDLKAFFKNAPKLNPKRKLIIGVICGIRVEDIKEPLMQNIRYLDKLVDELAQGKSMEKILRSTIDGMQNNKHKSAGKEAMVIKNQKAAQLRQKGIKSTRPGVKTKKSK
jgi:hypothetical protein